MNRGQIVDIRWGDPRDRLWLQQNLPSSSYRELAALPQRFRRQMSVYRCVECGEYGAFEGISDDVLMVWTAKEFRCSACFGCNCDDCRAFREAKA